MAGGRPELILGVVTLGLVGAAVVARALGLDPIAVFALAAVAIVPLSHFIGLATDEIGKHAGPGLGGLLNASFGNATELIIAVFAILAGPQLYPVVKASLTGSIIGNILLVLGFSMFVGGVRYPRQTFARQAATTRTTMMAVAVVALALPSLAIYSLGPPAPGGTPSGDLRAALAPLSEEIAVLLLVAYLAGLLFSLRTHRDIFNPLREGDQPKEEPRWSTRYALLVLAVATILVSVASETLVGALEPTLHAVGLNDLFAGIIVLAVIGNAAEHSTAVYMAWRNKMELSVNIAASSSTQIALFVAPLLVLFTAAIGAPVLDLAFQVFELVAIIVAVAIVNMVSSDGESNWYEGVLLLVVYAMLAIGFYFYPSVA